MKSIVTSALLVAAAAPAQEPVACAESPLHSALDFWVGDWEVYSGDEKVGENRIEKILGGCAIIEHWTGASGGEGKSLFYVQPQGDWRQVWVTEWALAPGGTKEKARMPTADDSSLRFQGRIVSEGNVYLDRTTLMKLPDGSVRQLIEISTDGGDTWAPTFDAVYRRSTKQAQP